MSRLTYGLHPVRELLQSNPKSIEQLLVRKGESSQAIKQVLSLARKAGITARFADVAELERLSEGGNHQGVLARVTDFKYADLDQWLKQLDANKPAPDLLILDHVQDPHNLGSLLRSAEVFGIGAVILPKDRSVSVTEVVARVSAGASEILPVIRVTNLVRCLDTLKQSGYWIIGTAVDAPASLYKTDLTAPCAFVLGNEGEGMSRLVKKACDLLVSMPSCGRIESLNVAVSGGVVLSEAYRQKSLRD